MLCFGGRAEVSADAKGEAAKEFLPSANSEDARERDLNLTTHHSPRGFVAFVRGSATNTKHSRAKFRQLRRLIVKNSTESGNLLDLSSKGKLTEGWKDIGLNGKKPSRRHVKPKSTFDVDNISREKLPSQQSLFYLTVIRPS